MSRLDLNGINRMPTSDSVSENEIELQSHSPGSSIKDESEDAVVSITERPATSIVKRAAHSLFHKHELGRALERPHIAGMIVFRLS
jgi:hypothetical protein